MKPGRLWFLGASLLPLALSAVVAAPAAAQTAGAAADAAPGDAVAQALPDIIVTAQKRAQSISDVGMSIDVQTGEQLTRLGINDTAALAKVTPGMNFTPTAYGTPIYTIRGVGFQDTSLAGSPTVSVYVDEVPLPFSVMTIGAALDVQRVEVLKGPQGILFGQNATGGAINYIANKPTDTFELGFDASYGRFNEFDFQGYVSGPLTETLKARVAVRRQSMSDWQKGYTVPLTSGQRNLTIGRILLDWEPSDDFRASLNLNGWIDKSDTQVPQFFGVVIRNPVNGTDPRVVTYPLAPHDNRAADRSVCINDSPLNEPYNETPPPFGFDPPRPVHAINCTGLARDNTFYSVSLRMEYDLSDSATLTSLTAYERYDRDQPVEGDGMIYQQYESQQMGYIDTIFQELRLSGDFAGKGNWIIGGNFERDKTFDSFVQAYGNSSSSPTLGVLQPISNPQNRQTTKTYAAFANVEYPITEQLSAHAGIRYTKVDKNYLGCSYDAGDGGWAAASQIIQNLLAFVNGYITEEQFNNGEGPGINPGPGGCGAVGFAPDFHPQQPGWTRDFSEDNISFRVGLDWKIAPDSLVYVNVSQGYKAGSFPTVATATAVQLVPAVQERLLAYEAGFKAMLADHRLQLNGAVFYYDYKDKQILGSLNDLVFGPLPALVNVPKSEVIGFELSGSATPVDGLTISSGVSYAKSKVKGDYFNFDPFSSTPVNFKGEPFPASPPWQAYGDIHYEFPLGATVQGFVGGTVNYQSGTRTFFYDQGPNPAQPADLLRVPGRALVDLRAGVESGPWRVSAYVRNLTDKWYWNSAVFSSDVVVRYTGMPRTYGLSVSWKY